MTRRLMYLQTLLQEDTGTLLHRFYKAQFENSAKGDWVEQVEKDMKETNIKFSVHEIRAMSKDVFRGKVMSAVRIAAFTYLCSEKAKLSKVMDVFHESFRIQDYFHPSGIKSTEAKLLFQLRSRMVEVKINFRNKYVNLQCPICETENDTQEHVFQCKELLKHLNILASSEILYSHIFHSDTSKQIAALRLFQFLFSERKKILKLD